MNNRWCYLIFALLSAFANHAAGKDIFAKPTLQNATFFESTYLTELQHGSYLSQRAKSLRHGGYELAAGESIRFGGWYKSKWTDTHITWLTQLSENLGFLWGASTGEKGKKYTLDPSLKLGLIMQNQPAKNLLLSLRATTILGGRLKEKSCTADYGDIGGVQEVNCRLAASTLPPEETLQYLLNEKPYNRNQISLGLTWKF